MKFTLLGGWLGVYWKWIDGASQLKFSGVGVGSWFFGVATNQQVKP